MKTGIYRKCNHSKSGYNSGDADVAFQLFRCGMVWDGNLVSKDSRTYLVRNGYAVRREGFQALTSKGIVAFLLHRHTWARLFRMWRSGRRDLLIADEGEITRALS